MNTPTSAHTQPHFSNTDPELGMYEIRVFWLAALTVTVAALAVAYFKMGYF